MRNIAVLLFVLLITTFSACESDDTLPQDCFEVKMIRSYCTGDAVLQIITPAAQSFGETWTNVDGEVFENVFRTTLPCNFDYASTQNGQPFSITLADELTDNDTCVRCAMLVSGLPEKFNYIREVSGCGSIIE